jgi:hypothetical protein
MKREAAATAEERLDAGHVNALAVPSSAFANITDRACERQVQPISKSSTSSPPAPLTGGSELPLRAWWTMAVTTKYARFLERRFPGGILRPLDREGAGRSTRWRRYGPLVSMTNFMEAMLNCRNASGDSGMNLTGVGT